MWISLHRALLFAGRVVSYANYRLQFPASSPRRADTSERGSGRPNTFVLLTSSLFVALATHFARRARPKATTAMLLAGLGLGVAFLGLKALEYSLDFREGLLPGRYLANPELLAAGAAGTGVFMSLYWLMTGLHALHVTVGMSVLAYVALARLARHVLGGLRHAHRAGRHVLAPGGPDLDLPLAAAHLAA
jgi:cytochrome c oxidase subunit 3